LDKKDLLKYGAIIGAGGVTVWALTRVAGLRDTADKLTINITKFNISTKGTEYLKFLLDLEFVNPSSKTISLSIPSIKPYYGTSELGYSVPMKDTKILNPKSITKIPDVEIRVPFQNLIFAGLITDILSAIKNLSMVIETLEQKVFFKIYAIVNGLEVNIEQKFGEEAKELGYIDELSGGRFEGIGLVTAGKRNIKDGDEFNYLFPEPDGTNDIVQNDGNVEDTVMWCGWMVKKYNSDTKELAEYLYSKSKTDRELYKNIFDFCYHHIQYHLDRKGIEELRRPARTWKDRKHGVDCDDYTMFIASILYNLGKPFGFRIAKYSKPNYQHIYLIVPVEDGTYITIDPVLDTFNYEKPYTSKKDFNMKSLNLAGTESVGIPIAILAGKNNVDEDLIKVVFGEDLKDTMNGLGSPEDDDVAMLRYLKRLRNTYVKNPDYIKDFQDPRQAVEMLDYAIKYWNTPKRKEAIERLAQIEDELIAKGEIKLAGFEDDDEDWEEDTEFTGVEPELEGYEYSYYDNDDEWEEDIGFTGTEPEEPGYEYIYEEPEWEEDFGYTGKEPEDNEYEYDYFVDGLGGKRRRKRKAKRRTERKARKAAKKAKRRARREKKGGLFRRIGKGIKKGFKTVAKGIVKVSATPARLAFLAALRMNAGGVSEKLKYAYLTEQQAIAMGIDRDEFRKLKEVHGKVEKMFKKLGGSSKALRRAILSGKRKNLRGFEELEGGLMGINEIDGFEMELGFSGNEPENPDYEYKYDNRIWEIDTDFSGYEPEDNEYDYDYSFDGLDGRAIRLRRRKKVKNRYRRHRSRIAPNKQAVKLLAQVNTWLKEINQSLIETIKQRKEGKQAFLTALADNCYNISTILAYGYSTESEAKQDGIDLLQWQKIRDVLEKAKALYKKELKGEEKELKKAILLGKDKPVLQGLGAASVIAKVGSAAVGLIKNIAGWLKNIKIRRKAKKAAKAEFIKSGGTEEEWKESGKKQFRKEWKSGKTSTEPKEETITTEATEADFSPIISNYLKSGYIPSQEPNADTNFKSGMVQNASFIPASYTSSQSGSVKENVVKAFLKKHKKKLLIGGSILGLGALAYFVLKPKQNEKKAISKKPASNTGVSGTKHKSGFKSRSGTKKLKEVKLR
jgi:hypothetical protein